MSTPSKTALSSPPDVPALLRAAAKTFEERSAVYGTNYKVQFGNMMLAAFPEGLNIKNANDWNRVGILVQMMSKITRYNANFCKGGHSDSLTDLSVYAMMLLELDEARDGNSL